MALHTRWAADYGLPQDPFRASVLVSGLYDLEPLRYSFLQPKIQLDDGVVRRNSPLLSLRSCAAPALLAWGEAESVEFARQSSALHEAWSQAGNTSTLHPMRGANHFSAIFGFEDGESELCRWVSDRLRD